jgi:hypothetical protein
MNALTLDFFILADSLNTFCPPQESPKVQFIGENIINGKHADLSTRADAYYNTNLSLGNTRSLSGKENRMPKRFMNPSKFVSSPYDNVQSCNITAHEHKLYEAITTLCDIEEHRE